MNKYKKHIDKTKLIGYLYSMALHRITCIVSIAFVNEVNKMRQIVVVPRYENIYDPKSTIYIFFVSSNFISSISIYY